MSVGGIIGKALRGASSAYTPMAMDQMKQQALAARDEKLHKYQQELQKGSQEFQSQENAKSRAIDEKRVGLEEQRVGLEGSRLKTQNEQASKAMELLDTQIQQAKGDLQKQKKLEMFMEDYRKAKDPEVRKLYENQIQLLANGKIEAKDLDIHKIQNSDFSESLIAVDPKTGQGQPVNISGQYRTPEEVRSAYQSGQITKDRARELISSMNPL